MKIRSAILFIIFTLSSVSALAKSNQIKPSEGVKITESSDEKKDMFEEMKIAPFDFQKIFSEAENYYKAAKAWNKLKCQPKSGFVCTKRECPKREVKAYLLLDKEAETITRCEDKICETFSAEFKQTGVFYNVQSEGPIGTLIRILGDSRYKEITTVGLDAYIANGNCEVVTD
jgi:hypothetical protein